MNREILIYAFRYALGRQSTASGVVVDYIIDNANNIGYRDLDLIRKEILEAIDNGTAGSEIDIDNWKKLINGPYGEEIDITNWKRFINGYKKL